MKFMIRFSSLLLLLLTSFALAEAPLPKWSGQWEGTQAQATFYAETIAEPIFFESCKVQLPLELTETTLTLGRLNWDCAREDGFWFQHDLAPATYSIIEERIYDETGSIGTFKDGVIEMELDNSFSGFYYLRLTPVLAQSMPQGLMVEWSYRAEVGSYFDAKTVVPLTREN